MGASIFWGTPSHHPFYDDFPLSNLINQTTFWGSSMTMDTSKWPSGPLGSLSSHISRPPFSLTRPGPAYSVREDASTVQSARAAPPPRWTVDLTVDLKLGNGDLTGVGIDVPFLGMLFPSPKHISVGNDIPFLVGWCSIGTFTNPLSKSSQKCLLIKKSSSYFEYTSGKPQQLT